MHKSTYAATTTSSSADAWPYTPATTSPARRRSRHHEYPYKTSRLPAPHRRTVPRWSMVPGPSRTMQLPINVSHLLVVAFCLAALYGPAATRAAPAAPEEENTGSTRDESNTGAGGTSTSNLSRTEQLEMMPLWPRVGIKSLLAGEAPDAAPAPGPSASASDQVPSVDLFFVLQVRDRGVDSFFLVCINNST